MASHLYIIYNAEGTATGKIMYGYRKLTKKPDCTAVCGACDITHGGLRLDETDSWKVAKQQIVKEGGLQVEQLHLNELSTEIKSFVEQSGQTYPLVLSGKGKEDLQTVMTKEELDACSGDSKAFVSKLREKGVLSPSKLA